LGNAPTTSPIPPTLAMGAASAATNKIRMVSFVSPVPIQLSVISFELFTGSLMTVY
jgi:alkanesulfonate monooxygenase SsuD/methylene tetrahydromethanopterin reductase-like flavin-dependent oxidoreductase (luciferase family)